MTSGGAVDGTFATTSAPGEPASLAMLPSGDTFAVGDVRTPKADFAAVRILANGGLDSLYAVTTSLTAGDDIAFAGLDSTERGARRRGIRWRRHVVRGRPVHTIAVPERRGQAADGDAETDALDSAADSEASTVPTALRCSIPRSASAA